MILILFGFLLSLVTVVWLMGGIEKVLTKLFPYVDIRRDGTDDIYLRRFFIYPRNKDFVPNKLEPRIYLHKFYRGDEDPHLHDHPWPFTSLILSQGYFEETPYRSKDVSRIPDKDLLRSEIVNGQGDQDWPKNWRRRIWYKPFTLLRRPATWKHRVILKDGKPAWTLVRTGVKERSWGFWTDDASAIDFCPWRQYDNGVCYCTPEEKNASDIVPVQP